MMNIVYKRVDEIIPYEKNPRINDAAVDAVAQSIKEFGFRVPIVLDKNNVIITGHTRLRSAKSIGLTEVPCIIAENLTPEQVQAYRIADNKTGEIAEWNYDLLPIRQAPAHVRRFHQGGRRCPSHERRESGSRFHRSAVWSQLSRSEQSGRPTVGGH